MARVLFAQTPTTTTFDAPSIQQARSPALLLISQRIIQEDVFSTGWERLLATVVGVVVAFAAIGVIRLLGKYAQDPQISS